MNGKPRLAIIDSNTLALLGLKQILESVMPIMEVDMFNTFSELEANNADSYFHYFVATNIVLTNRSFFIERKKKTIVLTNSIDSNNRLSGFHCLCVNVPEDQLVRSLLILEQGAHHNGRNLPPIPKTLAANELTDREIEVLSLITRGNINKEIANKLNISLTTVITHRKNIMEKLGVKSVSALTIYAVMHGYVDVNSI